MSDDHQLLRRYANEGSEAAFGELVARYVNLVYSAALRRAGGDAHLAQDVAQMVFTDLARKACSLPRDVVLAGWLHRASRFAAAQLVRTERRRQQREQEAVTMNTSESTPDWEQIRPLLDDALDKLGRADRDALVLRFMEQRSLAEVGRSLGLNEDAARKRVSRALEKLREQLVRRGVTTTAAALSVAITANAVQGAPVGLAAVLTGTSLSSAAAVTSGTTLTILKLMTATKLKIGIVSAVIVAAIFIALLSQWNRNESTTQNNSTATNAARNAMDEIAARRAASLRVANRADRNTNTPPAQTPEEIVTARLIKYGKSRRELANALARRHGVEVPDIVKLFFDAVEAGNWDEIESRWKEFATQRDRPDLLPFSATVLDAYGAAEQVHEWPAQKLLDYGNAVLDSLRPGMVYVGGTDVGRWAPELLNETSGREPHIMVTQNALADGTYLDFVRELYGEQFNALSPEDSQKAFAEYNADAQKRFEHDQQFPNEPKQVRPGENISIKDGKVQVSGTVAVMAINERILQALMAKNPDLLFAVQESYSMTGTYGDALPLGPLMELRAQNDQTTFTTERATESVDYWRNVAQNVLANPDATTLKEYSHDINSTANLLAAHNFAAEAEQAYRLSAQVWPGNPDAVTGLAKVLAGTGRIEEANRVLDDFSRAYPDQRPSIETVRSTFLWTAPAK